MKTIFIPVASSLHGCMQPISSTFCSSSPRAAPYDNSLPLPVAEYLQRPIDDFKGTDSMTINDRNIAALIRFYLGKPVEPPPAPPTRLNPSTEGRRPDLPDPEFDISDRPPTDEDYSVDAPASDDFA